MSNDQNVRKILIGKYGYKNYCGRCSYNVRAQVELKGGFVGVWCCVYPCPVCIAEGIGLGEQQEYNGTKRWQPPKPAKTLNILQIEVEPIEPEPQKQRRLNNNG